MRLADFVRQYQHWPESSRNTSCMKKSLFQLSEVESWLADHGQPSYRLAQIRRWLLDSNIESIAEMSDLPKSLREAVRDAAIATLRSKHGLIELIVPSG